MTFNLRIINSNLVASQLPLLEEQEVAHLTVDKAAGSSSVTVDNIAGFSLGKYVLLGNFGESTSEIIRIHASTVPTGSTITFATNTLYDHFTDTPVTVLEYNQIEFSRATTLAGSKSVVPAALSTTITRSSTTATATTASNHGYISGDIITVAGASQTDYNGDFTIVVTGLTTFTYTVANSPTTPATGTITAQKKAFFISADRTDTPFTDLTNTTGYGFYRFKNSTTGVYSGYSGGVPYSTGNLYNTYDAVAKRSCELASVAFGDVNFASEDQLLFDVNEAQDSVGQMANWSYELIKDDTSIVTTVNENTYDLSTLTYPLKYPGTYQGILDVRFGSAPLVYVSIDEMDEILRYAVQATLTVAVTAADTSITVNDSTAFAASGVVFSGGNTITYTANNTTTGVLSGIAITDITANVAIGGSVWQNINPAIPTRYAIFRNTIILDVPVLTEVAGYKLKFKYLKRLDRIVDFSSTLEVPFYNAIVEYVTGKIEMRKRNKDMGDRRMADFDRIVKNNFSVYKLPSMEDQTYYRFATIEDALPDNSQTRLI